MQFNQLKIPTNEINLNVVVEGKGTPIIFVHGWPESFYSWRHQINTFSKLGYTVIAPDIRGYGDSEKPTNVFDYSMKKITADLIGILDYLGEKKAHIIGHDWGAPIAWYTSLLFPNRILSVSGLSVPHSFLGNAEKPTNMLKKLYKDNFFYILYFQKEGPAEEEFEKNISETLKIIFSNSDYRGMTKNIETLAHQKKIKGLGFLDDMINYKDLPGWLTKNDLDFYTNQFEISGMRGPLNRYRCIDQDWEELEFLSNKKISKPSCFITGDLDPVNFMLLNSLKLLKNDESDEELLLNHINSNYSDLREFKIIESCGHWTQQEKPEEVNKILIDFLQKI